jgi:hypothetical protein
MNGNGDHNVKWNKTSTKSQMSHVPDDLCILDLKWW